MNKNGDTIASAVTNLDLHDIARAVKTYGAQSFYVATPLLDQKKLVERIVTHWSTGKGSRYNPKRCEALKLIKVKDSLDEVKEDIAKDGLGYPKTVVTSAKPSSRNINFAKFREILKEGSIYELTIKDIGKRGDGVAFFDKYVVYIPGAVKGSMVKVKIEKISGTVAFGRVVE